MQWQAKGSATQHSSMQAKGSARQLLLRNHNIIEHSDQRNSWILKQFIAQMEWCTIYTSYVWLQYRRNVRANATTRTARIHFFALSRHDHNCSKKHEAYGLNAFSHSTLNPFLVKTAHQFLAHLLNHAYTTNLSTLVEHEIAPTAC